MTLPNHLNGFDPSDRLSLFETHKSSGLPILEWLNLSPFLRLAVSRL
jgi:hypothetical protein